MCYNSLSIRKRGTRMARNRQNLNIIYISDRMRETLRPIASCALTAVVAPMGYGKTTAVRWFLAEQAKAGAVVLQASIYSDNRSIFWKSVQKAFAAAGQENMTLCCDFLALRLALCGKGKEGYDFAAKRAALLQKHDGVQVHLLESIAAYFYALQAFEHCGDRDAALAVIEA